MKLYFLNLCNKAARIQYLKNENGWAKEEIVIEHVINAYTNFMVYNKASRYKNNQTFKSLIRKSIKIYSKSKSKNEITKLNEELLTEKSTREYYQNLCKETWY